MTTLPFKSGSIYDTLYVSRLKKNTLVNVSRTQTSALNVYDASQTKPGHLGDRLAYLSQQCDKVHGKLD